MPVPAAVAVEATSDMADRRRRLPDKSTEVRWPVVNCRSGLLENDAHQRPLRGNTDRVAVEIGTFAARGR